MKFSHTILPCKQKVDEVGVKIGLVINKKATFYRFIQLYVITPTQ